LNDSSKSFFGNNNRDEVIVRGNMMDVIRGKKRTERNIFIVFLS